MNRPNQLLDSQAGVNGVSRGLCNAAFGSPLKFLVVLPVLFGACLLGRAQSAPRELMVMGVHPGGIVVLDATRDEVVAEIPLRGRAPKEIEFSRDGKRLYVTTQGRKSIEVVDLASRKVEDVIDLAPSGYKLVIYGIALSQDGGTLFAQVKPVQLLPDEFKVESPQIWAYDLATRKSRKIAEVPEGVASLITLGDGKRLVGWGRDLYFIDIASGRTISTVPLSSPSTAHASLDSLPLFTQYERSGVFSLPYYTTNPVSNATVMGLVDVDVQTGNVDLVDLGPAVPLFSAVVSPDRKRAYAVMNQLVAVDLEQRRVTSVINLDRTKYVVNISRDGKKLYVSGAGPFMDVYDTQSLKLIKKLELSGDGSVTSLRFLPPNAMP
jgi:DNA-binding beta-propeller fold protein YncE